MEMKAIRPASSATPMRVLVCEYDAALVLALEDALNEAGVSNISVCPSAALAMAALEDEHPDAILIDSHLSDRDDGWALAELIAFLGPKPPRIVFSTATPEEIPPEVARLGTIVEKPYDPHMLVDALISGRAGGLFSRVREALHR
jgi:CheY-like chemotaxis protein